MTELPSPHLLFLGDVTNPLDAKTAMGLRDWRPERCIGQYRLPGCAVDLGLPEMDFSAAATAGARSETKERSGDSSGQRMATAPTGSFTLAVT